MVVWMMRKSNHEDAYRLGSSCYGHSRGGRHRVRDVDYDSGSRAIT
jgi:hypothetical protein